MALLTSVPHKFFYKSITYSQFAIDIFNMT
jgi:hypothetical protein